MSQQITVAGLEFELKFCNKINDKPIEKWETSEIPAANIYNSESSETYTVNILTYIPIDFKTIEGYTQPHIDLLPEETNKLFFIYDGVSTVKTSINKSDENNIVLCRKFMIDYDSSNDEDTKFNLYHIKLHYRILNTNNQSVEAIIIHDKNLDPETSRGTVITTENPR